MDLAKRGGGHVLLFELLESLGNFDTQLGLDDRTRLFEGKRLDLLLETRERVSVGDGEQIDA